jgi:GNAT superfamily N-acetyltransferase
MPDMLVKLYELPEEASQYGKPYEGTPITVRRALPPERHVITRWVENTFNPHWRSECETALSRLPVSCFVATVTEDNRAVRIVGFGCYDATAKGFFGPTGVDPEFRGKGLGKALLLACLDAMRSEGYGYAVIGGAGPVDFYARCVGAVVIEGSAPGIYRGMLR